MDFASETRALSADVARIGRHSPCRATDRQRDNGALRAWRRAPSVLITLRCQTIGVTGFEPATSCSRSRRSTGLSYTPKPVSFSWKNVRPERLELPTF